MTIYFTSFSNFLDMNGYAPYVWSAWGVVIGMLIIQWVYSQHERRKILADIRRHERREKALRQSESKSSPAVERESA